MQSLSMKVNMQHSERRIKAIKHTQTKLQTSENCRRCGRIHPFNDCKKCPAYGSKCRTCGKVSHWEKMCRSDVKIERNQEYRRKVHHIKGSDSSDSNSLTLGIETILLHEMSKKGKGEKNELHTMIQVKRKIRNKPTTFNMKIKLDTGSQSNILLLRLYHQMFPEYIKNGSPEEGALEAANVMLTVYGNPVIKQLGKVQIKGKHKGKSIICTFFVVDADGPAILGLNSCQKLQLISVSNEIREKKMSKRINSDTPLEQHPPITNKAKLMDMYPECFADTVGCFGNFEYHNTIDPKYKPIIHAPWKVSIELKQKLKQELEEMEEK
ncbi:uncharacterized protein [Narcine bancroftii]|uniref:uncharacterized protein n=1 Tax=Narcine bancroftii TaxID=1343680 RepID=UPI003831C2F4